ncbi:MAG: AAA domain-containing protein [Luteolibacter sp.]
MTEPSDFIRDLESSIDSEARYGRENAERQWAKPLPERMESGRAIGNLEIAEMESIRGGKLVHFHPSMQDCASFYEGNPLRMSRNDPSGRDSIKASFIGLTRKGLTVSIPAGKFPEPSGGWSLDEEFIDLSEFYLRALDELAKTAHGRETVLPVLMGEFDEDPFLEELDEAKAGLASDLLDDSQQDAVANCLAAERFHVVQGPPGTGKTHALAQVVSELVKRGNRVLVTAFTHRAIHHALRKIQPLVDCPVFKISIPFPNDAKGIEFHEYFSGTGLIDHPGPYVIGATPIALFTRRASEARFDVAVIDETSQMRTEAALMPMLRAQRWFFFGDHQQLPPVVQRPTADPTEASVFKSLARGGCRSMLKTTYRLNFPLTEWPSENFYHGELRAAPGNAEHRFAIKANSNNDPRLGPEPSLVRVEIPHEGNKVKSDEEATEAADLIEKLLLGGTAPGEIGIVVPFRAQAARIRSLLRMERFAEYPDLHELTVDTVERFQGQEREVMIVSFVVSDDAFMDRLAGFLTQPQRLNVAITRAKTKIILIHSTRFRKWLETHSQANENAALALSLIQPQS